MHWGYARVKVDDVQKNGWWHVFLPFTQEYCFIFHVLYLHSNWKCESFWLFEEYRNITYQHSWDSNHEVWNRKTVHFPYLPDISTGLLKWENPNIPTGSWRMCHQPLQGLTRLIAVSFVTSSKHWLIFEKGKISCLEPQTTIYKWMFGVPGVSFREKFEAFFGSQDICWKWVFSAIVFCWSKMFFIPHHGAYKNTYMGHG